MKNDIKWKRCKNYHWFDGSRYSVCPQCEEPAVNREEKQTSVKKAQGKQSIKHTAYTEIMNNTSTKKEDTTKSMYDEEFVTSALSFGDPDDDFEDTSSNDKTQSMFEFNE